MRIISCVLIILLLSTCSSRRILTVTEAELKEGETVYSVICLDDDSISFIGYRVTGLSYSYLQEEFLTIEGEGAVFSRDIIIGVMSDGSDRAISVDSVSVLEVDRHNTGKTILYAAVIGVVASGICLLAIMNSFSVLPNR